MNTNPNLSPCTECGTMMYPFRGRLVCSECVRYGQPDSKNVPYDIGANVHLTCAPRTLYQVIEVMPATIHCRRGGIMLRKVRDGKTSMGTFFWTNEEIIEWRKANMQNVSPERLLELVAWAETLWNKKIRDYRESLRKAKKFDDPGSCVIGAGIEISNVLRKQIAFIRVPKSAGQGSITWEQSVGDVVQYLRDHGLDARYECGRMD